uniref:Uncharacterized protein n=1 Tax=Rhizophagus irregularis (strain DAOM 181602 / DAOM 197198 / MUCL 43194) TaxID=747089 RepID=U9TVN7_RHIID
MHLRYKKGYLLDASQYNYLSDRSPSPINEDAIDDSTSTSILLSMEPNNTNDNTKIWQVNRVYK